MTEENRSGEGSREEVPMAALSAGAPPVTQEVTQERAPEAPVRTDVFTQIFAWAHARFLGRDPTFLSALGHFAAITAILFSRWPATNYIFDEQEALLANPYVNATGGLRFVDAIHRDFWGLAPDRSIGSYRPIPNLLWRAIWQLSSKHEGLFRQPFVHHIYNVFFHAINAALVTMIVWAWTRRRGQAWLAGLLFATCAVLTEAISGIVGIADVLGGMGALLALAALSLPGWAMPFAVFTAVAFGLFSKESALVCVPLVPFAALLVAPLTHPERPARVVRAVLAFVGAAAAFYLYVELRRRWFPSPLPKELTEAPPDTASALTRFAHEFLVWFHQAPLPKDPLNNPLVDADKPHRIAGAMRVYLRGLGQLVFPYPLSGDYSFPQEPIPERIVFPQSVAGAALTALPPLWSLVLWVVALVRERAARRLALQSGSPPSERSTRMGLRVAGLSLLLLSLSVVALDLVVLRPRGFSLALRTLPLWVGGVPAGILGLGLVVEGLPPLARPDPRPLGLSGVLLVALGVTWVVVSYFPHSNIPVVLPTVRAERFWYFPAIGSTLVLAVLFSWLDELAKRHGRRMLAPALLVPFLLFQSVQAYRHAMDYRSDVDFWRSTKDAVPRSAKAHLNYSVMKGARGDLQTRLDESRIALGLAPKWAMAHIYTGDTLCRMHKAAEAWPYYRDGFDLGPNDQSLIALALQCLYDEKELTPHEDELRSIVAAHEGSWIAYLGSDTLANADKNKGVDPKYRPRGYNEGPKE
jgi:protein O-mannosyl-transferase